MVGKGSYPTSFSLTGRAQDQNCMAMPDVNVIVSNSVGGKFSTTTDPAGYYALDVATGVYLVNAGLAGYAFTQTTVQAIAGLASAARPVVDAPISIKPPAFLL